MSWGQTLFLFSSSLYAIWNGTHNLRLNQHDGIVHKKMTLSWLESWMIWLQRLYDDMFIFKKRQNVRWQNHNLGCICSVSQGNMVTGKTLPNHSAISVRCSCLQGVAADGEARSHSLDNIFVLTLLSSKPTQSPLTTVISSHQAPRSWLNVWDGLDRFSFPNVGPCNFSLVQGEFSPAHSRGICLYNSLFGIQCSFYSRKKHFLEF